MGIFNEHGSTSSDTILSGVQGPPGPQGIGFKLDANGNYDMENKKLTNVRNGDADKDVMVKLQIEGYVNNKTQYLDGVQPAKVTNNKAVIYSNNGLIHSNALYLKDTVDKEVQFFTENQDTNQIRLYIPNLKNNDSFNNCNKSSIVVTSIDQRIEGKKIFSDIEVPQPVRDNQACNKKYVDDKIQSAGSQSSDSSNFVKKTGSTMSGDLILQSQPYPILGNTNKAISYNTARAIFLSKKEGGSMEQTLDMNNHEIFNVKDPTAADQAANKKYVDTQLATKLDKADAKKYVNVDGSNGMTGNLNLNEKTIINLNTDDKDIKSAANVGYVSSKVHTAKGDVTVGLKTYFDTKIKESHITSSTNKKDVSRYLMENADESSSENNIIVDGIVDFSGSPHNVNKKAYKFKMGKDAQNEYSSRIGFNMFKLPEGEYTLANEFFPPSTTNLSVSVVSTSLNIGQQSTKLFVNYSRSIVHLHKWDITPPEYIYIDMHCQGTASSSTQGVGYLIVYGVKGSQSNVDSDVYDTAYVVENGKMVMQTDLSLNGHKLSGSVHYIHGYLNTKNGNTFLLNGCDKIIIPNHSHILTITVLYFKLKSKYKPISLKIKHSDHLTQSITYTSTQSTRSQTININLVLAFGHLAVELGSVVKNQELLMLIEYRVP